MFRFSLAIALAFLAGCDGGSGAAPATRPPGLAIPAPPEAFRETILRNMPTNSEQRCVGISVVTAALLDGQPAGDQEREPAEDVARRIYHGLAAGQQLRYPRQVVIDSTAAPIASSASIEHLGSLVTEFYKRDFFRLSETDEGRQKLFAAEDSFVPTVEQLDRILDADPDRTDAFFGSGSRTFADGTRETTHHVFLIGKQADGVKVVYDSNDPGSPIACRLVDRREGVEVEWTCMYRDTGKETTQRYLVVPQETFFRQMLGQ